jgi:hypothetical protein
MAGALPPNGNKPLDQTRLERSKGRLGSISKRGDPCLCRIEADKATESAYPRTPLRRKKIGTVAGAASFT